jgi:aminoglycoside 6'-N-acetyltransferase
MAVVDDVPVGLVRRSFLCDYPVGLLDLAEITLVPTGAMTIGFLIGDAVNIGRGLGTEMVSSALDNLWADHEDAECVIVAAHVDNSASWRTLEKAGMARVGSGEIEPGNPAVDFRHHVYRIDRPYVPTGPV